ncbi:DUF2335 domain-containing protein [Actinomycetospora endophytica]|uniref:DUF2335 domain-containing protein n=1 Tax=Actinomycetospora endophytica TaxID=2291215 RepID=A0ABS8P4G8_9PSEU|nr:DUF2335 domain-containing protein [Actinomycetospora endophytica]MCD2193154.1 DUF2335 domain-containing protein [Actinomycetospora endophytica]
MTETPDESTSGREIEQTGGELDAPQVEGTPADGGGEQTALYRVAGYSESHRGPLPSARTLHEYSQVMPDLPERVVRMAELEQAHRHRVDLEPYKLARTGQWLAFAVVIVVFAFCGFLVLNDEVVTAGIIAALDLVGLATIFIVGTRGSDPKAEDPEPSEPDE